MVVALVRGRMWEEAWGLEAVLGGFIQRRRTCEKGNCGHYGLVMYSGLEVAPAFRETVEIDFELARDVMNFINSSEASSKSVLPPLTSH